MIIESYIFICNGRKTCTVNLRTNYNDEEIILNIQLKWNIRVNIEVHNETVSVKEEY